MTSSRRTARPLAARSRLLPASLLAALSLHLHAAAGDDGLLPAARAAESGRAARVRDPHFLTEVATEAPVWADDSSGAPVVVFAALGHLYRVSPDGGDAAPLTQGPAYDAEPALSPDGKQVVFRSDRDGLPGLYVLDLSGGAPRRLTELPEHRCTTPLYSADGQDVVLARSKGGKSELMRVPAAGGAPQALAAAAGEITSIALTRDGKLVYTVSADGKTQLLRFPSREPIKTLPGAAGGLVAHPDGGVLLRWQPPTEADQTLLWARLVDDTVKPLRKLQRTVDLPRPGFLKGRGAFVVSDEGRLLLLRPDGSPAAPSSELRFRAPVQLTLGPRAAEAQTAPVEPPSRGPVLPFGKGTVFLTEGRLYLKLTGAEARPLGAPGEVAYDPAVSPDGKALVYCRSAHLGAELVRVTLPEGGAAQVLHTGPSLSAPAFSADGRAVVVTVGDLRGGAQLHRVPLGGAAVALPVRGGRDLRGTPTPTGVCFADGSTGLSYLPTGEAAARPLLPPGPPRTGVCTADGKALVYLADGVAYTAPLHPERPLKDGEAQRLTDVAFGGAPPLWFSGDGRLVVATPAGGRAYKLAALVSAARPAGPGMPGPGVPGAAPGGGLPGEPIELEMAVGLAPPPLWIQGVTLVDAEHHVLVPNVTIALEGGRVRWVGPSAKAPPPPAGAKVVKGARRYAMAGLIDAHGHLGQGNPRAYLAYGVTSVRTRAGGGLDRAAAHAEGLPLPRALPVATLRGAATPGEAEALVRRLAEAGGRLLELPARLDAQVRRAAAREAAARGVRLVAQVEGVEEMVSAVADGATVLEGRWGAALPDDVLQLLLRSGVYVTTELHTSGLGEHLLRGEESGVNPVLLELLLDSRALTPHRALLKGKGEAESLLAERAVGQVKRAVQAGVAVLPGSGGAGVGVFPGVSLVRELEALGRAGVNPWVALEQATTQAAEALGAPDLGRIAGGARADVILLAGNPAEDLRNLQRVVLSVRGGWAFRPELLLLDPRYRTTSDIHE